MRAEDQVFNFEASIPRDAVVDIVIVAINISDEEICCSYFLLRFFCFLFFPLTSLLAPGTTFLVFQCHRCRSLSAELQTLAADGVNVGVVDNVADVAN